MVRRRKLTNLKSLNTPGSQHGFRIQNSSPGGVQRLFLTVESLIAFGRFQIFLIPPHPLHPLPRPPRPPRRLRHPPPRLGPLHPHRQHPPPPRHQCLPPPLRPPRPPRRLRHPPPRLGPPHPHHQCLPPPLRPPPPLLPLQRRRHCCRSLSSASCGPPRRPLHFSSGPSAPLRRAPRQLRRS